MRLDNQIFGRNKGLRLVLPTISRDGALFLDYLSDVMNNCQAANGKSLLILYLYD